MKKKVARTSFAHEKESRNNMSLRDEIYYYPNPASSMNLAQSSLLILHNAKNLGDVFLRYRNKMEQRGELTSGRIT